MLETYQVCEVVAALPCHQAVRQAEADDVVDVGVQTGRVGPQDYVNQTGQEVVCVCRLPVLRGERLKNMLTALRQTGQFILRCAFGVHLNDGCEETTMNQSISIKMLYFICFEDERLISSRTIKSHRQARKSWSDPAWRAAVILVGMFLSVGYKPCIGS